MITEWKYSGTRITREDIESRVVTLPTFFLQAFFWRFNEDVPRENRRDDHSDSIARLQKIGLGPGIIMIL
jgi:hypothetical protein